MDLRSGYENTISVREIFIELSIFVVIDRHRVLRRIDEFTNLRGNVGGKQSYKGSRISVIIPGLFSPPPTANLRAML